MLGTSKWLSRATLRMMFCSIILFATIAAARADDCNLAPTPTTRAQADNKLVLERGSSVYRLSNCFRLLKSWYGSVVTFSILNNFEDFEAPSYLFVKSKRRFHEPPPHYLKLSRNPGWFVPKAGALVGGVRIDDMPFNGTAKQWNDAHVDDRKPEDFSDMAGLKSQWHSYIDADRSSSSTDELAFWRIPNAAPEANTSLTYYLIRFIPSKSLNSVSFYIGIPDGVSEVELEIISNIDRLNQKYLMRVE